MTEVLVWSGAAGGLAVGLYALFQFFVTGKILGVSSGYGNICGYISRMPFFHEGPWRSLNNWRLWFLIGLPLGGLLAALTSPGEIALSFSLGTLYDSVIPQAVWVRGLILAGGGVMIGYGSRMAGGCTSGHSIGGIALLNPPSIAASIGFFAGGIVAVQLLFRVL